MAVFVSNDRGQFASGLEPEWFSVTENNSQLHITSFENFDLPASVVFLFDLSGSIKAGPKNAVAEAAYEFVQKANRDNEYAVVGFDTGIVSNSDWTRDQQEIKKTLSDVVRHTPNHNTALYDACTVSLEKLGASKYSSRVLMLFSDGEDNQSKVTFNSLRQKLRESSVTLYSVGIISGSAIGGSLGIEGQAILDELASVTGGRAFYPRSDEELKDILEQISLEMSHHYTIRFSPPTSTPDKHWHQIKIKLTLPQRDEKGHKLPHVNVRSRQGYYDR